MTSIILFDIGNVLVLADESITHRILHERYGVPSERARQFYTIPAFYAFNRGIITGKQLYDALLAQRIVPASMTLAQVRQAHNDHIYAVDKEMERIVQETAAHQRIGFHTDANVWQTERVEKELIPLETYGPVFRSHELGALKIEAACYLKVSSRLGLPPEEIVLVDDSPEKIDMARKAGWRGILYKEDNPDRYKHLRRELASLGKN